MDSLDLVRMCITPAVSLALLLQSEVVITTAPAGCFSLSWPLPKVLVAGASECHSKNLCLRASNVPCWMLARTSAMKSIKLVVLCLQNASARIETGLSSRRSLPRARVWTLIHSFLQKRHLLCQGHRRQDFSCFQQVVDVGAFEGLASVATALRLQRGHGKLQHGGGEVNRESLSRRLRRSGPREGLREQRDTKTAKGNSSPADLMLSLP